jgi:hypothetical protein
LSNLRCLGLLRCLLVLDYDRKASGGLSAGNDPVFHGANLFLLSRFLNFLHWLLVGTWLLFRDEIVGTRRHFGIGGRQSLGSDPVDLHDDWGLGGLPINRRVASNGFSKPSGIPFA